MFSKAGDCLRGHRVLLMQITTEVFPFLGLWRNRTVCGGP